MTQTTFKTEDVTLERLKEFISDNPVKGNYWERQPVWENFLANWRSPEGLSLQEIQAEVARITDHYNKQAGALVDALNNISKQLGKDGEWELADNVDDIAQAAITQYGYDSYNYGTWVQSNY
jgi:hypothetical protein